ncbi:uracil-DNA glycosylase [Rubellimicrobium aerolatum]|uniref:Uracil-DNA glycosylase n=1 Tax=Rubellimicrobium aerolatum TaxID=490979 RepID=A0ABW0SBI5_9RHOB|nr:uracil-DNA glycosylase [Rubellimicrobium aerolatum]MBP1805574.1 uracil-DNA glycosylase [Rubellimicrobium aerolatum]
MASQPDLFAPSVSPVAEATPIPEAWADLPFFAEDWPRIAEALARDPRAILPPHERRFQALALTPPEAVRVVILGQDPYPTPGHAMGLAFSVNPDVRPLPKSLANVFREMKEDTGDSLPNGDLSGWARQGVLLLNTHLSVPAGVIGGHAKLGWEALTGQVLARVSERATAFVLWGRPAQAQARHIRPGDHLIHESAHPSPLSASRGFFGSRPFSKVNGWLAARGEAGIDWGASG